MKSYTKAKRKDKTTKKFSSHDEIKKKYLW